LPGDELIRKLALVSDLDDKRNAARAALAELPEHGIIGLGSGSTAAIFIEEVGRLVKQGRKLVGVPTSVGSRRLGEQHGIVMLADDGPWDILVTIDGADEIDERLFTIKGGGAAHAREKIVNQASHKNIFIVDDSKWSAKIGTRRAVPIEVLPFGYQQTAAELRAFGEPSLRMAGTVPLRTDAQNFIFDLRTGPIEDAGTLDIALQAIPGVVATGLFLGRVDLVLTASAGVVRRNVRH
jgi:ribose 5-phosphate isomerase A